ncbi:50S ribosomal protein L33 [Polychytrium aggregatum]|uniref:50S ribosomal protein L33 n=1 Tax=Polychytrium aggregatum TaxID=110093 RepID=UPI0022FDBBC9|nr:50S ribosomal protein L33 [Polychytrium aggregatum]XP_052963189.1 50S ribosomal protein L33 [Polychytrium aggregatum]KAI9197039.1 50S ribosomal protein L33 [Polychytrium aggregatum]KAI9199206.1 50S ribosomal protein L33 [Polychytrium aggregatum]
MAAPKAKARTLIVRLVSTAGTGSFYTTVRRRLLPKLQLMKFDPKVNRHVLFVESKQK